MAGAVGERDEETGRKGARESFVSLRSTIVDQNRRPQERVISNAATAVRRNQLI